MSTQDHAGRRVSSGPIYFAMFVPIIGLFALGAMMISDAIGNRLIGQRLFDTISLSTEASSLAHELQKERGMSAGHVGSKGAQFGENLRKQRAATDAMLRQLADVVTALSLEDSAAGQRFDARANQLRQSFDELISMRRKIDALTVAVPDLAKFYTGMIRALLSLPDDPLVNGDLGELARMNQIYKDVLMAKEFAGVERAAGSVGFGRGGFDNQTFAWYNGLSQRQSYLIDRVRELGTDAEVTLLTQALESEAANRVYELRALAAESLETGDVKGVTGPEWFAASTAYLGELRKLERALAVSLQDAASAQAAAAWNWAVGIGAVVLALVLGSALFGLRYVRSLIGGLQQLAEAIVKIERAEEGIEIPAQDRKDAIGEIARNLSSISAQGAHAARVATAVEGSEHAFLILDGDQVETFKNASMMALFEAVPDVFDPLAPTLPDGRRDGRAMLKAFREAQESSGLRDKDSGAIEYRDHNTILEVHIEAVLDQNGHEIGTTIQIDNVSEVRSLEKDVITVLEGVDRGEFTGRVETIDGRGFTSVAAAGLNKLTESIQTFMSALDRSLAAMAAGDLTQRIDQPFPGDFGRARTSVNDNLDAMVQMISSVIDAAVKVQTTANPISSDARRLAQRAEEQASALEEVNATMEEMTGAITRSAESADSASNLAETASKRAEIGRQVLGETREAMTRIEDSSTKVVEIVSVIDSIAFQTNLLALNAAVEAARAGEAGKGFAVVASEVRALAQRSGEAASEIRTLIGESTENVAEGAELMERTKMALEEITQSVEGLGSVVASIATGSKDQALSAKEISSTTSQLDELTQQNATVAIDSARGAEDLRLQADQLMEAAQRFKISASANSQAA